MYFTTWVYSRMQITQEGWFALIKKLFLSSGKISYFYWKESMFFWWHAKWGKGGCSWFSFVAQSQFMKEHCAGKINLKRVSFKVICWVKRFIWNKWFIRMRLDKIKLNIFRQIISLIKKYFMALNVEHFTIF